MISLSVQDCALEDAPKASSLPAGKRMTGFQRGSRFRVSWGILFAEKSRWNPPKKVTVRQEFFEVWNDGYGCF